MTDSASSHFQTPRTLSKILRCASSFRLCSRSSRSLENAATLSFLVYTVYYEQLGKLTNDHFLVIASENCFWISLYLFSSCKETDGTRLFNAFWKSVFVTWMSLSSSTGSLWPKKVKEPFTSKRVPSNYPPSLIQYFSDLILSSAWIEHINQQKSHLLYQIWETSLYWKLWQQIFPLFISMSATSFSQGIVPQ